MPEEKPVHQKVLKATFEGEPELPVHYVNVVQVRSGLEEFFLTLGTALPPEVNDIKDLESIDAVKVHSLFRFAMSRSVMKDVIDLMQRLYSEQTRQIEVIRSFQERDGDGHDQHDLP